MTWLPTPVFLPGESPGTEEPGGLQSMGLERVGHDSAQGTFFSHHCGWEVGHLHLVGHECCSASHSAQDAPSQRQISSQGSTDSIRTEFIFLQSWVQSPRVHIHAPSSRVVLVITPCLGLTLRQCLGHYYRALKDELTDVLNSPLGLGFLDLLLLNLVEHVGLWVVVVLMSGWDLTRPSVNWPSLHSSVGKESACNAGHSDSIPGSGRSPGEGIGYPLQYSWASLVAQLVKNPPAMQETWVQLLGQEDPLERK